MSWCPKLLANYSQFYAELWELGVWKSAYHETFEFPEVQKQKISFLNLKTIF